MALATTLAIAGCDLPEKKNGPRHMESVVKSYAPEVNEARVSTHNAVPGLEEVESTGIDFGEIDYERYNLVKPGPAAYTPINRKCIYSSWRNFR